MSPQTSIAFLNTMPSAALDAELISLVVAIFGLFLGLFTIYYSIRALQRYVKEVHQLRLLIDTSLDDPVSMDIFRGIKKNSRLARRLADEMQDEKLALAKYLAGHSDSLLGQLITTMTATDDNKTIFIESGSTLAYLARAISRGDYLRTLAHSLVVTTNNVLVEFLFAFTHRVSVRPLGGTSLGRYGATFGEDLPCEEPDGLIRQWRSSGETHRPEDDDEPGRWYKSDDSQFDAMQHEIELFLDANLPAFILMTSSSLSLVDGPHVGSFQNRDFKEILLDYARRKKIPVLLIIFDDKIHPDAMHKNECLSVLGDGSRNYAKDPGDPGCTGFERLARIIAKGEVMVIVTKEHAPEQSIGMGNDTQADGLFNKLLDLVKTGRITPCQVYSSSRNHVRVFAADNLTEVSENYRSLVQLLVTKHYARTAVA